MASADSSRDGVETAAAVDEKAQAVITMDIQGNSYDSLEANAG